MKRYICLEKHSPEVSNSEREREGGRERRGEERLRLRLKAWLELNPHRQARSGRREHADLECL